MNIGTGVFTELVKSLEEENRLEESRKQLEIQFLELDFSNLIFPGVGIICLFCSFSTESQIRNTVIMHTKNILR